MEKKKISTSQTLELKDAVTYLNDLLAAFKKGVITVSKGDEDLVLTPCAPVFLEIEAKKKKHKESFSFELSWHTIEEMSEEEENLSISSELPSCCFEKGEDCAAKGEGAGKANTSDLTAKAENKKEDSTPGINPVKK